MDEEYRRAAARRWFWSDHPLNLAFRAEVGGSFTLKAFVTFVLAMPSHRFAALVTP